MPKNRNKSRRVRGRPVKRLATMSQLVPMVVSQPVLQSWFRFRSTAAMNNNIINVRDILNLLHVGTTANNSTGIIASYRINHVRMYSIADGGASSEFNTISLTFLGGVYGKNIEYTSAGSSSIPGVLDVRTPLKSNASFWHSIQLSGAISGYGEPLLSFSSLSAGTLVDISLTFVICDGGTLPGNPLSASGSGAGVLYTNDLDNSTTTGAAGPQLLIPVARVGLVANG